MKIILVVTPDDAGKELEFDTVPLVGDGVIVDDTHYMVARRMHLYVEPQLPVIGPGCYRLHLYCRKEETENG